MMRYPNRIGGPVRLAHADDRAADGEMTKAESSTGRIPYLDGLRAFSVLFVVLAHAFGPAGDHWPTVARLTLLNSSLGVHVFFVLSGFLITSMLLDERERHGSMNLSKFYKRRIARIFPAFYSYIAFIVVLVTAGLAIIVWPATLSAATFTWNYSHLWIKDPGRNVHLLGHFWTLAVEEQFYLLWPALLRRWTIPSAITWSTAIILVMPFARLANDLLIPSQRGYEGMMFHTAADTILCGCLAGIWYKHESPAWVRRLTEFKGIGVVCLLAALYVVPLISERVRGFGTTLGTWLDGVVVAILLLHLLQTRPKWAGVFEWQAVAWVGTLSYSLYLWQQAFTIEGPTKLPAPWNIGACLLAAIASFYLIEQPARKALRRRWQV